MVQGMLTETLIAVAAAAAMATDGDADLVGAKHVRLQADTRGASSVTFMYRGKHRKGRLTDIDHSDREREWSRTMIAKRSDRRAGARVTFRVRACGGGDCHTTKFSERVEWDD
jgi:hypothetical protein